MITDSHSYHYFDPATQAWVGPVASKEIRALLIRGDISLKCFLMNDSDGVVKPVRQWPEFRLRPRRVGHAHVSGRKVPLFFYRRMAAAALLLPGLVLLLTAINCLGYVATPLPILPWEYFLPVAAILLGATVLLACVAMVQIPVLGKKDILRPSLLAIAFSVMIVMGHVGVMHVFRYDREWKRLTLRSQDVRLREISWFSLGHSGPLTVEVNSYNADDHPLSSRLGPDLQNYYIFALDLTSSEPGLLLEYDVRLAVAEMADGSRVALVPMERFLTADMHESTEMAAQYASKNTVALNRKSQVFLMMPTSVPIHQCRGIWITINGIPVMIGGAYLTPEEKNQVRKIFAEESAAPVSEANSHPFGENAG